MIGPPAPINVQMPAGPFLTDPQGILGPIWPILFVAIACGAISGWHSLVSSSSSSKQLDIETDALPVGGGAMFSEGLLALASLIAYMVLAPSFFVGEKKCFVMLLDNHHDDGRFAIWCAAPPGNQELLVQADPDRFFRPPYVGHRGWLGVMLDGNVDWEEVAGIVEDAFATVAPKKLL